MRRPLASPLPPHHPLGVGGHELAVPVQQRPVGADRDQRVVQRGAAVDAVPLVHTANHHDLALGRRLPQRLKLVAAQVDAVGHQDLVELADSSP